MERPTRPPTDDARDLGGETLPRGPRVDDVFPPGPGTRWGGRVVLSHRIGRGGMSDIWAGWDDVNARRVAVKVARDDDEEARAVVCEAMCLFRVKHPHLIGIHGAGIHGRRSFLELEMLASETLGDAMRRCGPAPRDVVTSVLRGVGGAVAHLHRAGYAHRDVKSDNVLFRDDGAPVLTDLGLALFRDDVSQEPLRVVGTPSHMAPEVYAGVVDDFEAWCRVDQYGLAVMSYELLTGVLPFEATSVRGTMSRHVLIPPEAPSVRGAAVSSAVDAVVLRALDKNPVRRFEHVEAFVQSLLAALEGDAETAREVTGPHAATGLREVV